MTKVQELTQKVSQCLKDEQQIRALHDAIRDMEPEEAEIMLADYLQEVQDYEFKYALEIKAQVDRYISRLYAKEGVNYAKYKLGR